MKPFSFFKGLSWLILLNALVKPAWIFFIDRQLQVLAGNEAYGKYFAVLNLSYVLLFIADAGLSSLLNQRIGSQQPVNTLQLVRLKSILILIYITVCIFVGWLTHITQWQFLIYVVIIQSLSSVFVFLRSFITAHQYFVADAIFSIIDKLLMLLLCGSIMYTSFFGSMSLMLFLQIQTICTSIAVMLAGMFLLQKRINVQKRPIRMEGLVSMILPFSLIIFLMSVHNRLDGFLLERLHYDGARETGVYAAAYRLLDAANMIGYLTALFLVPFIARQQKDKAVVQEAVLTARHGLLIFVAGLVPFVLVCAPWIQQHLYHSSDPYISNVIRLCMASLPAYFLIHIYGSVLTATAQLTQFIRILLISVAINTGLNLLLIPTYGATGSCVAALLSEYFCGLATCILASRHCRIAIHLQSVLVYLLSAGLVTLLFYFGPAAITNVWIILVIAVCVCLMLLAALLGLLKKYFVSLR
jgi:O-antigen/teichoic acid export membrane protein